MGFISERLVKSARERVKLGEERDRLTASRPADCCCLGMGNYTAQREKPDANGVWVVTRYCSCPEGIAAKAEWDMREARQRAADIAAFMGRAGLPSRFKDMTFDSHPLRAMAERLERWEPTPEKRGLFLYGSYGTGKTGLAVSLLRQHIQSNRAAAMFVTTPDLFDVIRESYSKGAPPDGDIFKRAKTASFLVLDDIGAERPTEWVCEKLYQLVNHRHGEELTTVFTSNLTMSELAERIGERTCWRIAEMCSIVHVEGPNLRDKRP